MRLMKTLAVAILLVGTQVCAPDTSRAQSSVQQLAKEAAEFYVKKLAGKGLHLSFEGAIAYFKRNEDEAKKPKTELMRRVAACHPASTDPLCEALRDGPQ